jgi:hypothetical protein
MQRQPLNQKRRVKQSKHPFIGQVFGIFLRERLSRRRSQGRIEKAENLTVLRRVTTRSNILALLPFLDELLYRQ